MWGSPIVVIMVNGAFGTFYGVDDVSDMDFERLFLHEYWNRPVER